MEKIVPKELMNGIDGYIMSDTGVLKFNGTRISPTKSSIVLNKHGFYKHISIRGKLIYFH